MSIHEDAQNSSVGEESVSSENSTHFDKNEEFLNSGYEFFDRSSDKGVDTSSAHHSEEAPSDSDTEDLQEDVSDKDEEDFVLDTTDENESTVDENASVVEESEPTVDENDKDSSSEDTPFDFDHYDSELETGVVIARRAGFARHGFAHYKTNPHGILGVYPSYVEAITDGHLPYNRAGKEDPYEALVHQGLVDGVQGVVRIEDIPEGYTLSKSVGRYRKIRQPRHKVEEIADVSRETDENVLGENVADTTEDGNVSRETFENDPTLNEGEEIVNYSGDDELNESSVDEFSGEEIVDRTYDADEEYPEGENLFEVSDGDVLDAQTDSDLIDEEVSRETSQVEEIPESTETNVSRETKENFEFSKKDVSRLTPSQQELFDLFDSAIDVKPEGIMSTSAKRQSQNSLEVLKIAFREKIDGLANFKIKKSMVRKAVEDAQVPSLSSFFNQKKMISELEKQSHITIENFENEWRERKDAFIAEQIAIIEKQWLIENPPLSDEDRQAFWAETNRDIAAMEEQAEKFFARAKREVVEYIISQSDDASVRSLGDFLRAKDLSTEDVLTAVEIDRQLQLDQKVYNPGAISLGQRNDVIVPQSPTLNVSDSDEIDSSSNDTDSVDEAVKQPSSVVSEAHPEESSDLVDENVSRETLDEDDSDIDPETLALLKGAQEEEDDEEFETEKTNSDLFGEEDEDIEDAFDDEFDSEVDGKKSKKSSSDDDISKSSSKVRSRLANRLFSASPKKVDESEEDSVIDDSGDVEEGSVAVAETPLYKQKKFLWGAGALGLLLLGVMGGCTAINVMDNDSPSTTSSASADADLKKRTEELHSRYNKGDELEVQDKDGNLVKVHLTGEFNERGAYAESSDKTSYFITNQALSDWYKAHPDQFSNASESASAKPSSSAK